MIDKFETNFTKRLSIHCWEWQGARCKLGYGSFNLHIGIKKYTKVRAARLSYEIYNGSIPEGFHVLHKCDNPACVNPSHLSVGTPQDNMTDMVEKNRSLSGHKNHKAKFTEKEIIKLRKLIASEKFTLKELAERYDVNLSTIKRIKYNLSYLNKDIHAYGRTETEKKVRYWGKRLSNYHGLLNL